MSRIDKVSKNIRFAIPAQAAFFLINFVVRRVFTQTLTQEYLGLNGLFADILKMLSLAELGFGGSILFSLYKPVAEGDTGKIKSLMQLYRKAYHIIAVVVLAVGLSLTPFLDFFVREMPDIPHIEWIYILNIINSAVSYLFIYKSSLLYVYQQRYVQTIIATAVGFVTGLVQIAVLVLTHDYFFYLGTTICSTLAQNLILTFQTDRMYPYLREKDIEPLPAEDVRIIRRNVLASIFHKFGTVVVYGTDNVLMAKFVSVAAVGIYSNYTMIRSALKSFVGLLYGAITASLGNLNAVETIEKKRAAFDHFYFFSAWLFGWMSICLLWLYNPFIALWLGEDYLFPMEIVLLIVVLFYMDNMRQPALNSRDTMGLFWYDRYKPLAEAVINLVASILLAQRIGIAGVLLGTLISTLAMPFWVEPVVVYHWGLKQSPAGYFARYALYFAVTAVAAAVTGALCALTPDGLGGFVLKMAICAAVPHGVYLLAYWRTENFRYLWGVALRLTGRFLHPGANKTRQ